LSLAIVDGSGVISDPEGLDRSELKRLAQNRLTISHFDASKLSPNGFKILIDEQSVKLPSMLKNMILFFCIIISIYKIS
jgi:glutamate dehydrogenase